MVINDLTSSEEATEDLFSQFVDAGSAIAGAAAVLIAGATGPGAPLVYAFAWAATQVLGLMVEQAIQSNEENYRDEEAKQVVKCHMYNNIKGQVPQFNVWSVALDDFVPATTPEEEIANSTIVLLKDLDAYINYLMVVDNYKDIAEYLPQCPCPEPFVLDQLSGAAGTNLYHTAFTTPSSIAMGNPTNPATVNPGVWYLPNERYYDIANSSIATHCNIAVQLPANVLITNVRVKWGISRPLSAGGGDKNARMYLGDPAIAASYIAGHSWGAGIYSDQNVTTSVSNPAGLRPTPEEFLYVHNSSDKKTGRAYIQWIHIEGIPYVP